MSLQIQHSLLSALPHLQSCTIVDNNETLQMESISGELLKKLVSWLCAGEAERQLDAAQPSTKTVEWTGKRKAPENVINELPTMHLLTTLAAEHGIQVRRAESTLCQGVMGPFPCTCTDRPV